MDAQLDVQKFAEKLVKSGREGVLWERRKLEWILQEKQADQKKAA